MDVDAFRHRVHIPGKQESWQRIPITEIGGLRQVRLLMPSSEGWGKEGWAPGFRWSF